MQYRFIIFLSFFLFLFGSLTGQDNQIAIPRIELMPDQPSPYNMRDWKQVAINYDRYVYDQTKQGTYLPLFGFVASGNNYPENPTFGLHTYVGTNNPNGYEGINILPSIVGASLVGVDKSAQNGYDYVLMAQDFFNKKNGQNLYLNSTSAKSGNDWWYDMMPNVFFYQLYDLYPNMKGEADYQFNAIAENMLEAVRAMGGSETPWSIPSMNYRAWKFETMEPLLGGVPEPEASGAFGWLLYMAYTNSGKEEYRKGAEWAIEYLNSLESNPSYELQLPYGTYIAARMNAELGTHYNVEKMVNWSFDKGNLRGWGTIVDQWSGLDVSGLVGESESSTDYAFQLNGVQQAAALVPMVRYDKRFARAIAKWVLNLANANRFFYHGFLPSSLQDASAWSEEYDPNQVIGYEAIRETYQGLSPYSTGDAVIGGWAATNLALYGTSSIGYLGGMIEKTNVEKVLKIDLIKTDFFGYEAYPTYLYYNPYDEDVVININVGQNPSDIYDALSESFILNEKTGVTEMTIPAKSALMAVICPAGGNQSFNKNQFLIDGIVVDFDQHQQEYAQAPRIKSLATEAKEIEIGKPATFYTTIEYEGNSEHLNYNWKIDDIIIENDLPTLEYGFDNLGEKIIEFIVSDNEGLTDTAVLLVEVVDQIDYPPVIYEIIKSEAYGAPGMTINLTCIASEEIDGPLEYLWSTTGGTINAQENQATWQLPAEEGVFTLSAMVTDTSGLSATKAEIFLVKSFSNAEGNMIAYYPLDGTGDDFSGNELHGEIKGAVSTENREGESNKAYFFNGGTNHMIVNSDQVLNFQKGISVCGWFEITREYDRESFIISHGSWENRWKVSIIPEQKLRWTINTNGGIRDLDSQEALIADKYYHFVVTYDGSAVLMFIDGNLVSFTNHNGDLKTTSLPLLLAQSLPGQQEYNFQGILDEMMIFDFALNPNQVASLYEFGTITNTNEIIGHKADIHIYPNPGNGKYLLSGKGLSQIDDLNIYNIYGQLVYQNKSVKNIEEIDLRHLLSGIYYMQFKENGIIKSIEKIIKQ